jgi:hypothetical protein
MVICQFYFCRSGGFTFTSSNVSDKDIFDTIKAEGIDRPTKNSNERLIYATREGIENFWRWFDGSRM